MSNFSALDRVEGRRGSIHLSVPACLRLLHVGHDASVTAIFDGVQACRDLAYAHVHGDDQPSLELAAPGRILARVVLLRTGHTTTSDVSTGRSGKRMNIE